jgi:PDDEXK-like domain of unknown function (DUF3799)
MKKKKINTSTYRQRPEVANSDLSNALVSEELYLAVKDGSYRKITYPAMKEGTIAHSEILTPELFWDEFYLQAESLHPKQKEFVDNIIAARSKEGKITASMIEKVYQDVYTKPKEGDGMILYTKLETHIKGLFQGKEPITMAMRITAEKRRAILEKNKEAAEILKRANIREEEIFWEMEGVKCKAKIDANAIEQAIRNILLVDIKISMAPMSEEEAIEKIKLYKYPRQLRYYERGIRLSEDVQMMYDDISSYTAERYIIYVDPVVARVFKITDETAIAQDEEITKGLNIVKNIEKSGPTKKETILV